MRQHPEYTHLWGYVQYSRPLESRDDLDRWVPTFLAGQFGEELMLGFAGPGGSQDNSIVIDQIRLHIGSGPGAMQFFQGAYSWARNVVQTQAAAVQTVAHALVERETLQAAEVRDLIKNQDAR